MTADKRELVIHAFRSEIEERMESPEFNSKLAELLKPNTPTRLAVELFRELLYKPPKELENPTGAPE